MSDEKILSVQNVSKYYKKRGGATKKTDPFVKAVNEVSFDVSKGETLGLVGESGCGKSSISRCIMKLQDVTSGDIFFEGESIKDLKGKDLKHFRRNVQMIFQNPFSSLNPRMTVGDLIGEPLRIHEHLSKRDADQEVKKLIELVGLSANSAYKYPHEFSGGQRQRIVIARALALRPELVICDEPVSALDVSVQSQILNLLNSLKKDFQLTYIFISHNIGVVGYMSQRIAVMYRGTLVELADAATLIKNPLHPYTKTLLSAVPSIDRKRKETQDLSRLQSREESIAGNCCIYSNMCEFSRECEMCRTQKPVLTEVEPGHYVCCHLQ